MKKLTMVVFFGLLSISLARALRMVCRLSHDTAMSIANFYAQVSVSSSYYVGVKTLVWRDNRIAKIDWLWNETATPHKQIANNISDYIKRQIPTIADRVIIRKASPVKDNRRIDMRIGEMSFTPGVNGTEYFMLKTISSILSAGKLIRGVCARKPKWNDL